MLLEDHSEAHMLELLLGFQKSAALVTAASLGLADHVHAGLTTVAELSAATHTLPDRLRRLVRALSQSGIFTLDREGHIGLTDLGHTLRRDHERSLLWAALMLKGPQGKVWEALEESLRDPKLPFERLTGQTLFGLLNVNEKEAAIFHGGMVSLYGAESELIANTFDFSWARRVVDVGGGNGHLLNAIVSRYPSVEAILFEQPHAIRAARSKQGGACPDICLVEGDFFTAIPSGADIYILRHVLHDWDDNDCIAILTKCGEAMTASSIVLIVEMSIESVAAPLPGPWGDLDMMLITGGKERSMDEYQSLCTQAGLVATEVISTAFPSVKLVKAVKVRS